MIVPTKRRFATLDWARGWMLVASVGVNSILIMPAWFGHATWSGVHPLDVIFPMFVTLSGCGLAFAYARRVDLKSLIRRMIVLLAAGLLYNAVMDWSFAPSTWRFTGVLQLYALIVPIIAILHLVTRSAKGWAGITALLAIAHSTLLLSYGAKCPSGVITRECNPSGPIDSFVFGEAHIYLGGAAGHDPEGIVVVFGALVSASAGVMVGHLLRMLAGKVQHSTSAVREVGPLLGAAAFFAIIAWFLVYLFPLLFSAQLPIMKRLWTAPFALLVAVGTTVLLSLGYLLIDRRSPSSLEQKFAYPLISLGRNSLLVYFGSHVLMRIFAQPIGSLAIDDRFALMMPSPLTAQLAWSIIILAFWIAIAAFLHRRKIYVKP